MAYTDLTFVAGNVLAAADLNVLRDNFRFMHDKGGDLASASTITPTSQFHKVTGSTTIDNITALAAGARVVLWFTGAATIKHLSGGTGNIRLPRQADLRSGATGFTPYEFICDGTLWYLIGTPPTWSFVKNASTTVSNTVSKTDLLGGAVTIPAGTIPSSAIVSPVIHGRFVGTYLNNSGTAKGVDLELKLGSTVIWDGGASSGAGAGLVASDADTVPWIVEFEIVCNAQSSHFTRGWFLGGDQLTPTTGLGVAGDIFYAIFGSNGNTSTDMTLAQTLTLSVTHSGANASTTMVCSKGYLEVRDLL